MKLTILRTLLLVTTILLVLTSFFVQQSEQPALFWVKGKITHTNAYCGGALRLDLVKKARIPVPLAGKTIYFKQGKENELREEIVDSAVTDTGGNFALQLPAGQYCIIEHYKTQKLVIPENNKYAIYDSACLKKQWSTCDYSLVVENQNVDSITINYHIPCNFSKPCQNYHGPVPR